MMKEETTDQQDEFKDDVTRHIMNLISEFKD